MLRNESEPLLGSYRFFELSGSQYIDLGIIHDEGTTITAVYDEKEITDQDKTTTDHYLFLKHFLVSARLKSITADNVARSIPGTVVETDDVDPSRIKISVKGGRVGLYSQAKTYVLKPLNDMDNENEWIILHKAANMEPFSVTFREDEEATIPLNLICFKDRATGNIITFGDESISV